MKGNRYEKVPPSSTGGAADSQALAGQGKLPYTMLDKRAGLEYEQFHKR